MIGLDDRPVIDYRRETPVLDGKCIYKKGDRCAQEVKPHCAFWLDGFACRQEGKNEKFSAQYGAWETE